MFHSITGKISGGIYLLQQVYILLRPYGRRRLAKVFLVSLLQAVSQFVSVAAVFPFLAIATDPTRFSQSRSGQWVMLLLPVTNQEQLFFFSGIGLIAVLFFANGISMYSEFYRERFTWRIHCTN